MSDQITTAFVEQYSANVEHLAQQMECRFEGKVRTVSQKGKTQFFEQLGETSAVKRTTRHADTPRVDSNHQRRQVTLTDYDWSDLVDTLDDVKLLISPASAYAQSAAMAFNRAKDQEVIDSAIATAYADTGGGSIAAVSFPSAQTIEENYTGGATAVTGLTLAKLVQAKSILGKAEVPRGEKLYFVHTQQQLDDLLVNVDEVKSSDYAAVKALVNGDINYFMGFEFIKTELLDINTSSVRSCIAYSHNSLLLAMGQGARGRISERADKNHATQVYYNMSIGSTRMQEKLVVEVQCSEA